MMEQADFFEKYKPSPTKDGRPAKRRSAYKFFKLTQGMNIREQYPDIKGKVYTQRVAEIFAGLNPEDKKVYEDMSIADEQRVLADYAELGINPNQTSHESNGDDSHVKRFGKKRRWTKADGAPKKALTAYIIYVREQRAQLMEEIKKKNLEYKPTDIISELSRRWNEASTEIKEHYKQMSYEDKERYLEEKAAWIAAREAQGIFEHSTIKRNNMSDDENEGNRTLKVRVKGEELFDKITVRRLTWKGLVKKIQDKKGINKEVESITHLPDIRIRDSEDVSTLPEYAELEVQFVEGK